MEAWESASISISFSWQIAFPHNKDLGELVPDFSPSQYGAHRICFPTKIQVWKWVTLMCTSVVPGCKAMCTSFICKKKKKNPAGWAAHRAEERSGWCFFHTKKILFTLPKWNLTLRVIWNVQKMSKCLTGERGLFQSTAVLRGEDERSLRE